MKTMFRSMIVFGVFILAQLNTSQATLLVEYDAVTAGAGNDPTAVVPAWTRFGTPMVNNGAFLSQDNTADNPTQESGEYRSPSVSGLMKLTNSTYGISFKGKPLGDIAFLNNGGYANLYATWSDDQFIYNVTIDQFTNDANGTGGIKYGQGSLSDAITGVNWSIPHQVGIGYRGDSGPFGVFDFYLDGDLQSTIGAGSIARTSGFPFAQNAVDFGDGTTAAVDVAAEWYNVRLYSTAAEAAIPEPSTVAL